jgi:hypothetical protein
LVDQTGLQLPLLKRRFDGHEIENVMILGGRS